MINNLAPPVPVIASDADALLRLLKLLANPAEFERKLEDLSAREKAVAAQLAQANAASAQVAVDRAAADRAMAEARKAMAEAKETEHGLRAQYQQTEEAAATRLRAKLKAIVGA